MAAPVTTAPRRRAAAPAAPAGFRPHVEAGTSPFAELAPTPVRASTLGGTLESKLNAFATRSGNGKWPNLPRVDVAARLTAIVRNPALVDQAGLNACGPAVTMHLFAKRKPEAFADFAIELYDSGEAYFGSLKVSGEGLVHKDPAKMGWRGSTPNALDWMLLSAVLRSEGGLTRFGGEPSDDFSGITWPSDMEKWLKDGIGYSDVQNEANHMTVKGLDHLRRLSPTSDLDIVLLINVDNLEGSKKGSKKAKSASWGVGKVAGMFPNHYVELEKAVVDNGTNIAATVWTWGQSGYPLDKSHDAWKGAYFGAFLARV